MSTSLALVRPVAAAHTEVVADAPLPTADALGGALLRPRRARLGAVCAALDGVANPRAAWALLGARGLIPPAWCRDLPWSLRVPCPNSTCDGLRVVCGHCRAHHGAVAFDAPPDLPTAVALAADVDALVRAQALVAEVTRRGHPWGVTASAPAVWVGPRDRMTFALDMRFPADPWEGLLPAALAPTAAAPRGWADNDVRPRPGADEYGLPRPSRKVVAAALRAGTRGADDATAAEAAGRWLLAARAWRWGADARTPVPPGVRYGHADWAFDVPEVLRRATFAQLPDPFAPGVAVWTLGYGLGPRGVLLVPALDPWEAPCAAPLLPTDLVPERLGLAWGRAPRACLRTLGVRDREPAPGMRGISVPLCLKGGLCEVGLEFDAAGLAALTAYVTDPAAPGAADPGAGPAARPLFEAMRAALAATLGPPDYVGRRPGRAARDPAWVAWWRGPGGRFEIEAAQAPGDPWAGVALRARPRRL